MIMKQSPTVARADRLLVRSIHFVERYLLIILLIGIIGYFGATTSSFFTLRNLQANAASQTTLAILAIAALVPLVAGEYDLSIAATQGTTAIATAAAMSRFGASLLTAVIIALAIGALIGITNGALVAFVGADSLIVTLGTAIVMQGLVTWYTGGITISRDISDQLINLGTGQIGGIPNAVLWLAPAALGVWYLLDYTPWGRYLAAVGSNREASVLLGLQVRLCIFTSFVVSALLSTVAGILLVARQGSASPSTVLGAALLPAFAAVFLGTTTIRPGTFNVPGTIVAVAFVAASISGLILSGAEPWVNDVFNGSALVIAISASTVIARHRRSGS